MTQKNKLAIEIICVILAILVFIVILSNHYIEKEKVEYVNPRFAVIDYDQLQRETILLETNKTNKTAKNVFVLNYHLVTNGPPEDEYDISYEQFKENMFALKREGYQTVNLSDFYLYLRGEKELMEKSFLLTFDDGAKSTYYNADPILKALNYTAVMFIITDFSLSQPGNVYYLNKTELLSAQESGRWELESHTDRSHYRPIIGPNGERGAALTNKLWITNESRLETDEEYYLRAVEDLITAKDLLEYHLNKNITAFSLPFGDFGEKSNYPYAHKILYSITTENYKMVFHQFNPSKARYRANYNDIKKDSYVIVRLSVDNHRTPQELLKEIEASESKELPYYEDFSNIKRWSTTSGELSFNNSKLLIRSKANEESDIRSIYLDGSYLWENYTYSLEFDGLNNSIVSLISRLKNPEDYTSCQYGNGFVKILNTEKNVQKKIADNSISNLTSPTYLSMSVNGSEVTCSVNGIEAVKSEVPSISVNGGIGLKIERFNDKNKTFTFSEIAITPIKNDNL